MKLKFDYKIEKELDNLNRGITSKNHPGEPPEIVLEMRNNGINLENEAQCIEYFDKKLKESNINPNERIIQCNQRWSYIQDEAVKRFQELFKTSKDIGEITTYLTLNKRCGYNIKEKYFFVSFFKSNTNSTIIHELLHFYTYEFLLPRFIDLQISRNDFNDFKEALTFLMNEKFEDILDGFVDKGYPEQKELREYMLKKWFECEDLYELTDIVIVNYFIH